MTSTDTRERSALARPLAALLALDVLVDLASLPALHEARLGADLDRNPEVRLQVATGDEGDVARVQAILAWGRALVEADADVVVIGERERAPGLGAFLRVATVIHGVRVEVWDLLRRDGLADGPRLVGRLDVEDLAFALDVTAGVA